jgi:hypothetical protein
MRYYINGVEVATTTKFSAVNFGTSNDWKFGTGHSNNRRLYRDDLRLFNRAISAAEMLFLAQQNGGL